MAVAPGRTVPRVALVAIVLSFALAGAVSILRTVNAAFPATSAARSTGSALTVRRILTAPASAKDRTIATRATRGTVRPGATAIDHLCRYLRRPRPVPTGRAGGLQVGPSARLRRSSETATRWWPPWLGRAISRTRRTGSVTAIRPADRLEGL